MKSLQSWDGRSALNMCNIFANFRHKTSSTYVWHRCMNTGNNIHPRWVIMPRALGGGIKGWCCLKFVCLSVTYIGNNLITERPRRPKLAHRYLGRHTWLGHHLQAQKVKVNLQGRGNIVGDSRTSLIVINSLIFMVPTAIGSNCALGAASVRDGLQRPAYSGRGHIVSPRAQLVCKVVLLYYQTTTCSHDKSLLSVKSRYFSSIITTINSNWPCFMGTKLQLP